MHFLLLMILCMIGEAPTTENNSIPEFRAVWNHSGTGAFPGDWERSAKLLEENGFNAVLPNMLWGGSAHYASDILPRSETFKKYGDQIEQCCAAAKSTDWKSMSGKSASTCRTPPRISSKNSAATAARR